MPDTAPARYAIYHRDGDRPDTGTGVDVLDRLGELPAGSTLWLHLAGPSHAVLDRVAAALRLPRLAVEDAVAGGQRVKREDYHDVSFAVLKPLRYTDATSAIDTDELMLFVGGTWVVSVAYGPDTAVAAAADRLAGSEVLQRAGVGAIVYALADQVVDGYVSILAEVQQDLNELERAVFSADRIDRTQDIYLLKREILEFQDAAVPLVPVVQQLAREHDDRPHLSHALRDVADNVERVAGAIRSIDELINSVVDANASRLSIRQNEDMRRISAWAAILAVPTLVAGVYGMNFQHMPELRWYYGYPACLAFMVATCLVLYRIFRKNGWL